MAREYLCGGGDVREFPENYFEAGWCQFLSDTGLEYPAPSADTPGLPTGAACVPMAPGIPRYEANDTSIYGPHLKNSSKKGARITNCFVRPRVRGEESSQLTGLDFQLTLGLAEGAEEVELQARLRAQGLLQLRGTRCNGRGFTTKHIVNIVNIVNNIEDKTFKFNLGKRLAGSEQVRTSRFLSSKALSAEMRASFSCCVFALERRLCDGI
jgi:hypothetical protein